MHLKIMKTFILILYFGIQGFYSGYGQNKSLLVTVFRCKNGVLINQDKFCNGIDDCGDSSDENVFINDTISDILCDNQATTLMKRCSINKQYICNGIITCTNTTYCDAKCNTHYQCQNGVCMQRRTICDGPTGKGCSEDHGWTNGIGFKCKKNGVECVLPQQLTLDDVSDCDGNIDRCFEYPKDSSPVNPWNLRSEDAAVFNTSLCFQCFDNFTIIPRSAVCDGIVDCPDTSDECICQENATNVCTHMQLVNSTTSTCKGGEFKCYNGTCINASSVCNGKTDCSSAEDESYESCAGTKACADATAEDLLCRCTDFDSQWNWEKITGIPCDNIEDCRTPSIPYRVWWTGKPAPDDECLANCSKEPDHNFTCGIQGYAAVGNPLMYFECVSLGNVTTVFITLDAKPLVLINGNKKCDGIIDCFNATDEANCLSRFKCSARNGARVSIPRSIMCNGIKECDLGEDETKELCGKKRFFCEAQNGKLVSIDRKYVCDMYINCDDGSDEANCSSLGDRFYCENKQPLFVAIRKIKDGWPDCTDWSDECPTRGQFKTDNAFSSNSELIANIVLRVWVWIMAFLALVGNSGSYCSQDLKWRSSSTCSALGVMSSLSSEASILIMIMLTSCRLFAVLKPASSMTAPTKLAIRLMIFGSWFVAFLIALIPLSSSLQNVFIGQASFTKNPFALMRGTTLEDSREMLLKMITYDQKQGTNFQVTNETLRELSRANWDTIKRMGQSYTNHPEYFKDILYFGYFSQSVCVQRFFVKTSDKGWEFSFFINLFNFFSFLYVASAYVAIYIKATKKGNLGLRKTDECTKRIQQIQNKILRLIITDFCCWIPISLMAFHQILRGNLTQEAYAFAAIVLLPINSALNPILYSDILDKILGKIKSTKDAVSSTKLTNDTAHGSKEITIATNQF